MHFITLVPIATLLTTVLAIPAATTTSKSAAPTATPAPAQWTMKSFTRVCKVKTTCNYSFSVVTNDKKPDTKCAYAVAGPDAATQAYQGIQCGNYAVSSSWSGQFGPGNGFQVLALVKDGLIIYPGYTDKQLANGTAVTPDQSYSPAKL